MTEGDREMSKRPLKEGYNPPPKKPRPKPPPPPPPKKKRSQDR